jgi:hypothetical protein
VNMGIALARKQVNLASQNLTMDRASMKNDNDTSAGLQCSTSMVKPLPMDILCGRDRNYTKHPGNKIYRQLLEAQSSKYETKLSKVAKMEVTKYIVGTMQHQHGSRFIRRNDDGWEEISNTQARDKTSHAIRFLHKNSNRKMQSSSRSEIFDEIHHGDTFAATQVDKNQNLRNRNHSFGTPKSDLPQEDSFETIDDANIAIESPFFQDMWLGDQSSGRDDFGNFHDILEFNSPPQQYSGPQTGPSTKPVIHQTDQRFSTNHQDEANEVDGL